MGFTLDRVFNSFEQKMPKSGVEKALFHIAGGIDSMYDLIEDSHSIQMADSRKSDLGDKKAKALMVVIQKIITRYQRNIDRSVGCYSDEEIFKLFEKAKIIQWAKNETEFQSAIADL